MINDPKQIPEVGGTVTLVRCEPTLGIIDIHFASGKEIAVHCQGRLPAEVGYVAHLDGARNAAEKSGVAVATSQCFHGKTDEERQEEKDNQARAEK